MKMNKTRVSHVLFGVATAVSLAIAPLAYSQTANVVERTTVTSACGKLFDIDANADGLTAAERAAIIQKNLDNALIKALHRTPNAVTVQVVNRNPTVQLDGMHIATADGNSATRNRMTQMQLAEKWAEAIRLCLSDVAAVDRYLSMLTGNYPKTAVGPRTEEVAYLPAGKFLPVKLACPINGELARVGDKIEAVLSTDVPVQTTYSATRYEAYLPAGSVALGRFIDASNSYLGKNALGIEFSELRTPDGEIIPINAHILGGVGTWVVTEVDPVQTQCSSFQRSLEEKGAKALSYKGEICGGWRGYPYAAGQGIPYQKMVISRKAPISVAAGEPMILQLEAPTALAVCTNCSSQM